MKCTEQSAPGALISQQRWPLCVALFSAARVWGGAEEQARLLARGLRKRGHTCCVFARRNSHFATRLAQENLPLITFRGTGRGPASIWKLRQALGRLRPDVVHSNDSLALTCSGLASLGLRVGARVTVRHNSFPIRWPVRYRHLCDRMICVAAAVANACLLSGIPSEKLRVVHAGCPPQRTTTSDRAHTRRRLAVADNELLAVNVALLNACKGHAYLLDALATVLRHQNSLRVALAGDGELADALKTQATQLGIADRVQFLGFRHDVPDLLRAADLLVMSSLQEGICSVLIESMLAECPIVTTTAGGIPELLEAADKGEPLAWTAPAGDAPALAAAILDALSSASQRARRAQRARAHAEACFTDDRMVDNTLAVYHELLASPCNRRS
jgi:glycosyltransferase involved in cell wall biosynthesis